MTVTAVPLQPVKRSILVWLWLAIVVLVGGAFLLARQGDDLWTKSQRDGAVVTTPSGLKYKVLTPGEGPHPADSDVVLINYVGRLRTGTVFDASRQPTPNLANGFVPGFNEAIKLMSRGEKLRIWLPAKLAYGADEKRDREGNVVIAANSPLMFDVELLGFMSQEKYQQFMMQQQMMQGGGGMPGGPGGPGTGGAPGGEPGEQVVPPQGQ